MKKLFTIALLFLFLLNVLGFYGIFLGIKFKSAQDTNRDLDQEMYSNLDMVTIKVPLSAPYLADNQEFERVSGEFEHDGDVYRLVKQKYSRDTLTLVCVKDNEARKINQALTDYVKTFTDKPVNAKQQNGKALQSFCKDYETTTVAIESLTSGWNEEVVFSTQIEHHSSFSHFKIKYPPRVA